MSLVGKKLMMILGFLCFLSGILLGRLLRVAALCPISLMIVLITLLWARRETAGFAVTLYLPVILVALLQLGYFTSLACRSYAIWRLPEKAWMTHRRK
jgi:hypothetical protein